jgi:hypothetical protein
MYQALAAAGAQCLLHGEACDLTPQKITGEIVAECSGGCADQPGLADRDDHRTGGWFERLLEYFRDRFRAFYIEFDGPDRV